MAKRKKKKVVDNTATFKNGMNKERVKNAAIEGCKLLGWLCLLGVFAYFVMMIPGLSGVFIAKEAETRNQTIYDIQNAVSVLLGTLVGTIGIFQFAKGSGESDAMFAVKRDLNRKFDFRYAAVMVAIGVAAYYIIGTFLNIDFFVGPVKYLSILIARTPRVMPGDDPQKIGLGFRLLAMLIYMVLVTPCAYFGVKKGYAVKMAMEEEEEERLRAHREETAENAQ